MAERLILALVAAYGAHVHRALATRGIDSVNGLDEAVREGEAWLESELDEELNQPFRQQRRGPLEIFQEAMRFPTEALEAAGIEPVARDEITVNALPGDVYDLAPASSRDLGDAVWEAHLAWGAAKARALGAHPA